VAEHRCFALVSFEGPDWYAWRGGLAERLVALATHLADRGFETHYYFLGDPHLPGEERFGGVPLVLHRWAQWLSRGYPGGAYDGEEAKRTELAQSLPSALYQELLLPALAHEVTPVVLVEEWQTVPFVLALSRLLEEEGMRERVPVIWRMGSLVGLDQLDWDALRRAARLTVTTAELQEAVAAGGAGAEILSPTPASLLAFLEADAPSGEHPPTARPASGIVIPSMQRPPARPLPIRRVSTTPDD
jgi:hypothetical protein